MLRILHDLPPLHWALAGALVGAGLLGSLYPTLQRPFALPPLKVGTGEG